MEIVKLKELSFNLTHFDGATYNFDASAIKFSPLIIVSCNNFN